MATAPRWLVDAVRSRRRQQRSSNWVLDGGPIGMNDDRYIDAWADRVNRPYRERIASRLGRLGPISFIDESGAGTG